MVNFVWLLLIASGIAAAWGSGQPAVVTDAALAGAQQSISVALELAAVLMLWMGLLACAEKSGLTDLLAKALWPLVRLLFPHVPKEHPANAAITMNISANLLGLGNAATPFGIKAMEELQKLNGGKKKVSDDMITFLVLNTSAITLIPANVIALRAGAGSVAPAAVVLPVILSSAAGLVVGLCVHWLLKRFC